MRYVQIGARVIYQREETSVIGEYQNNGQSYFVLDTSKGQRYVPVTKFIWTGNAHAVTPEGHAISQAFHTVKDTVKKIQEEMKKWDQAYPNANSKDRETTVKSCGFSVIEKIVATNKDNDKQLGFIVRGILAQLEEI